MRGLRCPHCGRKAITLSRKLFLGRHTDVSCISCGRKVGVSAGRMLAAYIPFGLAFLAAMTIDPLWTRIELLVGGGMMSFLLWWLWLPLEPR